MIETIIEIASMTYEVALPFALGYIVWLLKEQKKKSAKDAEEREERIAKENEVRNASAEGMMLLLRLKLIEYHSEYMEKGEIPSYAYENFNDMYTTYHKLGGNGMVTKMKEEIEELHFKRKTEERR